jgi:hypothetical protein
MCARTLPLLNDVEHFVGRRWEKLIARKVEPGSVQMRVGDDRAKGRRGWEAVQDFVDVVFFFGITTRVSMPAPSSQIVPWIFEVS